MYTFLEKETKYKTFLSLFSLRLVRLFAKYYMKYKNKRYT